MIVPISDKLKQISCIHKLLLTCIYLTWICISKVVCKVSISKAQRSSPVSCMHSTFILKIFIASYVGSRPWSHSYIHLVSSSHLFIQRMFCARCYNPDPGYLQLLLSLIYSTQPHPSPHPLEHSLIYSYLGSFQNLL